jgi:hypothetical protein
MAILHPCEEPGCRELTFYGRCPAHTTPEDERVQEQLHEANVAVIVARERLEEAMARRRALEERAGVRHT